MVAPIRPFLRFGIETHQRQKSGRSTDPVPRERTPVLNALQKFDQSMSEMSGRLAKLETIRSVIGNDEVLANMLLQSLATDTSVQDSPSWDSIPPQGSGADGDVAIIVSHFRRVNNDWQQISAIQEATQLPRNRIQYLLYNSRHQDLFEGRNNGSKCKLWRLREVPVRNQGDASERSDL